jgi:hypothetical protein
MNRRDVLRGGLSMLAMSASSEASSLDGVTRTLRVTEEAGLRRFGYPVQALLGDVGDTRSFRLTRGGQIIPAQFRPVVDPKGQTAYVLDFNASPGPLESQDYTVEFGRAAPEPTEGMRVARLDGIVRISNGKSLAFDVPEDLSGLLKSAVNAGEPFLAAGGRGLAIRDRVGKTIPIGGSITSRTISREGPMAVGLRFESSARLDGGVVRSTIDLTFPRSKSWVEVTWQLDDPLMLAAALEVGLRLAVEGEPTLIDLGASSTIYGQIRGDERMILESGKEPDSKAPPRWRVLQGHPDRLNEFAVQRPDDRREAEGWAHLMDHRRCTAIAVADFGKSSHDRLQVDADGRLAIDRRHAGAERPKKALKFWLHFVSMPVQVGAATSPQSMLSPLKHVWI